MTINSIIKISIKNITGFPKNRPLINFTIPKIKIEIIQ